MDLKLIDKEILNYAVFLDGRAHLTPITLSGGKFLALDINQYNRDKAQREAPPPGPQESNQKQPALGPIKGILRKPAKSFFAEQNSENQESSFEKNTPLDIPNLLPQKISGFKSHFADGPPLGPQESNQKQPFAEGPPLGPQKTSEQPVAERPQKRENSPTNDTSYYLPTPLPKNQTGRSEEKTPNTPADLGGKTPKTRVTWAEKMEQVRFIPGRESNGR